MEAEAKMPPLVTPSRTIIEGSEGLIDYNIS